MKDEALIADWLPLGATGVGSKKSSTSGKETAKKLRQRDCFAPVNCLLSIFSSVKAPRGGREGWLQVWEFYFFLFLLLFF